MSSQNIRRKVNIQHFHAAVKFDSVLGIAQHIAIALFTSASPAVQRVAPSAPCRTSGILAPSIARPPPPPPRAARRRPPPPAPPLPFSSAPVRPRRGEGGVVPPRPPPAPLPRGT